MLENKFSNFVFFAFAYFFPLTLTLSPFGARESSKEKKLNEVERIISNCRLSILLYVHLSPINVVVFYDPSGKSHLGVGFVLRCFQRLSFLDTATLRCYWRNNRHTVGPVNSVLSY